MSKIDFSLIDTKLVRELIERDSPYLQNIKEVYALVKPILNTRIPKVFTQYTLHDIDHSKRVMEYMADLANDLKKYSDLELTVLVFIALLHDIGMAVTDEDIEQIKKDAYPGSDIKFSVLLSLRNGNEEIALQDFIRSIHAKRSAAFIEGQLYDYFHMPLQKHYNFAKYVALICQSHNEDFEWIKNNLNSFEVLGDETFNPEFCSYVLRLADLLEIDNQRTPFLLYRLINPLGFSNSEWKQHFIIKNYKKVEFDEKHKHKVIVFHGESSDSTTHRKFLNYVSWINSELQHDIARSLEMQDLYQLAILHEVRLNIKTVGYTFSNDKLNIDFKAITSLLMGEKIYGEKSLGLREIIQNSMDACIVLKEIRDKDLDFGEDPYKPIIKVILDKEKNIATVKDNGLGMSYEIIKKFFLNIGVSYYNSESFLLKDLKYRPIGNFGIGFLSCFMLSEEVKLITRHYLSNIKYTLDLQKGSEYITTIEDKDLKFEGTEVVFNYSSFLNLFNNEIDKIETFLSRYFITELVKIELIIKDQKKVKEVTNLIDLQSKSKGVHRIFLNKYLAEIEGYIDITISNRFASVINDIGFKGDPPLYFDGKQVREINDISVPLKDLISNNTIHYIEIPIITYSDTREFDKYYEVLGDFDDAVKKMEDLNWITILGKADFFESFEEDMISGESDIAENLPFGILGNYDHELDYKTKIYKEKIDIFKSDLSNLNLLTKYHLGYYSSFFHSEVGKIFLRNILVKDYNLDLGFRASTFEVESYRINVLNKSVYTDISRNKFPNEIKLELEYAINKAIHLFILNECDLNNEEKVVFKEFIERFFEKKSILELT